MYPEIYDYLEEESKNSIRISRILTLLNEIVGDFVFKKKTNQKDVESQQKIIKRKEDESDNFSKQIVWIDNSRKVRSKKF